MCFIPFSYIFPTTVWFVGGLGDDSQGNDYSCRLAFNIVQAHPRRVRARKG